MYTPNNSVPAVEFFALAGVSEAEGDGVQVSGTWSDLPVELNLRRTAALAEEFANWPNNPESILKFTRKYGPLEAPHSLSSGGRGAPFRFLVEWWRQEQRRFQMEWQLDFRLRDIPSSGKVIYTSPNEYFVLTSSGLKFRAGSLLRLLYFGLDGIPSARLRICLRPDCTHPYFAARHLKQTYCSDECARWGQRQWKKQWWAEHGDDWRATRRKTKRSKRGNPRGR